MSSKCPWSVVIDGLVTGCGGAHRCGVFLISYGYMGCVLGVVTAPSFVTATEAPLERQSCRRSTVQSLTNTERGLTFVGYSLYRKNCLPD